MRDLLRGPRVERGADALWSLYLMLRTVEASQSSSAWLLPDSSFGRTTGFGFDFKYAYTSLHCCSFAI